MVAGAEDGLDLAADRDRRAALRDDEEGEDPWAALALARDRGACGEGVLLELPGQPLELGALKAREEGNLAEGVDLDRHGRG